MSAVHLLHLDSKPTTFQKSTLLGEKKKGLFCGGRNYTWISGRIVSPKAKEMTPREASRVNTTGAGSCWLRTCGLKVVGHSQFLHIQGRCDMTQCIKCSHHHALRDPSLTLPADSCNCAHVADNLNTFPVFLNKVYKQLWSVT